MDDLITFGAVVDDSLVPRLRAALPEIGARAGRYDQEGSFPVDDIQTLRDLGLLTAFAGNLLGEQAGSPQSTAALFDTLRLIGRANLSLGRIFEGHVNAAVLVDRYGSKPMRARVKQALLEGKLFGVWNTELAPGVSLETTRSGWVLTGAKNFATGAGHLDFALITARLPTGEKQMLLAPMGGQRERARPEAWRVSGMRATVSGIHEFSGAPVATEDFIGAPGDYEREPTFTASAWRFAAVQLGGIEALVQLLREHMRQNSVPEDPVHRARFARAVAAGRTAFQWVREAANRTELAPSQIVVPFVLMTRGVVEDAALQVIEAVQRSVGTRAFFIGNPIDRIIRDLQLYLRQPVPDEARDRAARAWLETDPWDDDRWW